ncbi:MAG TPA: transposase [Chitinophagaceae bacterium]|nr:transposase [Chitinophagaceae bacterium]
MKEDGYKIRDQHGVYFITFSVVQWVDVFTRRCYIDTLLNSLQYCIKNKGLRIHAWCLMSNHLHLILSAENGNLSGLLRDFKSFTAKEILQQIAGNKEESRKSWMLWLFKQAGSGNSRNENSQFWQQDNQPVQLQTVEFTLIKLNYLHNNPVKAGIVDKAENYLFSSARDYNGVTGLLPIEHLTAAYTLRH